LNTLQEEREDDRLERAKLKFKRLFAETVPAMLENLKTLELDSKGGRPFGELLAKAFCSLLKDLQKNNVDLSDQTVTDLWNMLEMMVELM